MNSETGGIHRPSVKGKTADIQTFQQKFEGSRSGFARSGGSSGQGSGAKVKPEPGYMQKVRAKAHRRRHTARKIGSALVLPTGKKIEALVDGKPREHRTYKVRRGVLTVTNQDGETVMQTNEKGLDLYNGLTLRGETNDKGEIELKRGMGDRRKLAEGNGYVTPREEPEIREDKTIDNARKTKDLAEKTWRGGEENL